MSDELVTLKVKPDTHDRVRLFSFNDRVAMYEFVDKAVDFYVKHRGEIEQSE